MLALSTVMSLPTRLRKSSGLQPVHQYPQKHGSFSYTCNVLLYPHVKHAEKTSYQLRYPPKSPPVYSTVPTQTSARTVSP